MLQILKPIYPFKGVSFADGQIFIFPKQLDQGFFRSISEEKRLFGIDNYWNLAKTCVYPNINQ